ncbi:MAG: NCS2 family permease [Bdellovibrionales bacterium]|nr:NCS2 family permease [Bdellovibrionales bacterium]
MNISLRKEIIGGITTFLTVAYIIFVNPSILATEGTGMSFSGVMTATVILSFSMTLLMGLYAKLPFAVAPGMGINAFFTFSVILGQQVPWQTALGIIFWAGVLFLITSIAPIRMKIATAIPSSLRIAAACGIGFFLTLIGLKNAGLVVANPATLVALGPLTRQTLIVVLSIVLILVLMRRKSPLAFLAGIAFATVVALATGMIQMPTSMFSAPDFSSVFFKLDIWGALKLSLIPTMVSIFFTDLFDSISTFVGVSHATGMLDRDGNPKNLKEGLITDALATLFAGLFGTSSGTAFIESAAGIEAGARTGTASIVTALCFLPCLFLAPIAGMVPAYATAPVLIVVGGLMFKSVTALKFDALEDLIPAFLTIVLIPFTFSITQGMLWGFIAHVVLYALAGRRKDLSPWMMGIGALSLALLIAQHS